jgi:hypothetical protein
MVCEIRVTYPRWLADRPENLAIFRAVVCAIVLGSAEVHDAPRWAEAAATLRAASPALAFPLAGLPITSGSAHAAYFVLTASCALGLVGLATRAAILAAACAATYLLGVPQLVGSVTHDHHLVWFLALLAASPCGDALSLDALWAARRGRPRPPPRGASYGIPIWGARLLVATIFFFPGLWKLRESGWAWIASDNFRNQMYFKWYELQWIPGLRADRYPWLCHALAFSAVAFELTFPFAILSRRTRPYAVAAALAFHLGTQELMGIRFTSLWLTYVVFFDVWYWARRTGLPMRRSRARGDAPPRTLVRASAPGLVTACALLVANAAYGWSGRFQAWPFACYPTFQWVLGEEIPHLAIDAVTADGSTKPIAHRPRSQKEWGLDWTLIGAVRGPTSEERLRVWWRGAEAERAEARALGAVRIRFHRAASSVVPERWNDPPVHKDLLAEIDP